MSFRFPVDTVRITGEFGADPEYYKQFGQNGHNGIDLAAPAGTPVYAADEGTIVFEGWGQNHSWMGSIAGICIIINHIGSYGGYAHLSRTVISKGDRVTKGQLIGYVGAAGAATGLHLHFEMLPLNPNFKNGFAGRINPMPYIDTVKKATREQVIAEYKAILERDPSGVDEGGIKTWMNYPIEAVQQGLANSQEKRDLEARKAEAARVAAQQAAEAAAKALADAEKAKEVKAAEDAAKKAEADRLAAEAESARVAEEERIAREKAEERAKAQLAIEQDVKEKNHMTTADQENIVKGTESVVSASDFTPIVSDQVKTIAYFATDITAIATGLVLTLLAIFSVLDGVVAVTINAAIVSALLALKQTFRISSKKQ